MDEDRIPIEKTENRPEPGSAGSPSGERPIIRSACELFACRVCRTKTGWPHQKWCELCDLVRPDCGDCRYWNVGKNKCGHPARRGGGVRK